MTGTDPFEQMSDMAHSDASIDPGVAAALRSGNRRACRLKSCLSRQTIGVPVASAAA